MNDPPASVKHRLALPGLLAGWAQRDRRQRAAMAGRSRRKDKGSPAPAAPVPAPAALPPEPMGGTLLLDPADRQFAPAIAAGHPVTDLILFRRAMRKRLKARERKRRERARKNPAKRPVDAPNAGGRYHPSREAIGARMASLRAFLAVAWSEPRWRRLKGKDMDLARYVRAWGARELARARHGRPAVSLREVAAVYGAQHRPTPKSLSRLLKLVDLLESPGGPWNNPT